MAVKTYKMKPDQADGIKLENDPDELRAAARWCNGQLVMKFVDGDLFDALTYLKVPSDDGGDQVGHIGDYVIKYWDEEKHGDSFYVVEDDTFEASYEPA